MTTSGIFGNIAMNIDGIRDELTDAKRVQLETIYRLTAAIEHYDPNAENHIRRMSNYCAALGHGLGWNEKRLETLTLAASMHDIGKIGVPKDILIKAGQLTADERAIMKQHTVLGARILGGSDIELLNIAEIIALTHHERWDGSGYPAGLKGTNIPAEGRIAMIADVFDAMVSNRRYRDPLSFEEALGRVKEGSGRQFDPDYVSVFDGIMSEISSVWKEYRDTAM